MTGCGRLPPLIDPLAPARLLTPLDDRAKTPAPQTAISGRPVCPYGEPLNRRAQAIPI
jgi:hypothetical protein